MTKLSQQYFLVGLQEHNDYQLQVHYSFHQVEDFIRHVVPSFVRHVAADTVLVIKRHPMERGYRNYGDLIKRPQIQFSLGQRLHYIHDLHLPSLLRHARGVVIVNSTVGLSALFHETPVKT